MRGDKPGTCGERKVAWGSSQEPFNVPIFSPNTPTTTKPNTMNSRPAILSRSASLAGELIANRFHPRSVYRYIGLG